MNNAEQKLQALLTITNAINSNVSVEELSTQFEEVLVELNTLSEFALISCKPEWTIIKNHGVPAHELAFELKKTLSIFPEPTRLVNAEHQHFYFDLVIPVFHKNMALAFLLIKGNMETAEINFLQTLTNIIAVAIENKRLVKNTISQEIAKHDLQIAAEIQRYLVPEFFEKNNEIQAHGIYKPHSQIGGDYYDLIHSGEEYFICMADVSGKGVSAAILMANFQAQLRTLIKYTNLPLDDLIIEINKRLNISLNGEKFITLFIAKYNPKTRLLSYINAGHNPPILIEHQEGRLLKKGTIGLGMMAHLPFLTNMEVKVAPDTVLTCYTDGVIEQLNEQEEEFDLKRVEEIMLSHQHFHPSLINAGILKAMEKHRGNKPYNDDISLLSCRFV